MNKDDDITRLKTENFDLLDLNDSVDDDILAKYLDENDHILKESQHKMPQTSSTITESKNIIYQQNSINPSIPIVPRMLFSNSTVTINYNFGK